MVKTGMPSSHQAYVVYQSCIDPRYLCSFMSDLVFLHLFMSSLIQVLVVPFFASPSLYWKSFLCRSRSSLVLVVPSLCSPYIKCPCGSFYPHFARSFLLFDLACLLQIYFYLPCAYLCFRTRTVEDQDQNGYCGSKTSPRTLAKYYAIISKPLATISKEHRPKSLSLWWT